MGGKMPDRLSQEYKMEQQLLLQVVFLLLQLLLHGLVNICYGFINIIAYIYSKGINMQQVTPTVLNMENYYKTVKKDTHSSTDRMSTEPHYASDNLGERNLGERLQDSVDRDIDKLS